MREIRDALFQEGGIIEETGIVFIILVLKSPISNERLPFKVNTQDPEQLPQSLNDKI